MIAVHKSELVTAECIFGIQRLLGLLDAFSSEIEGVRSSGDIEHIHRMRVASRRLRAALPLFRTCFPEKKFNRWTEEIQRITRALGDARDTDVQIAFLIKLEKKKSLQKDTDEYTGTTSEWSDAESILLSRLQKKRSKLQNVVISALDNLEKSGMVADMRESFTNPLLGIRRGRSRSLSYGIPPVAAARISRRLDLMLSYERWVHDSDAITEHHAMRIAAKKLRYTMEVYAPLYRLGLKKPLLRVKKIQELLGELHDCDVWIDTVMAMLLKERSTPRVTTSSKNIQAIRLGSFRQFLSEREKERRRLYRRFVRFWEALGRARIWAELRRALLEGIRIKFRLPGKRIDASIGPAVSVLAAQYPDGILHGHTVTSLALTLFDDLVLLHHMKAHERFLLECACSLHDIGWKYGQKGHAKRSAEMVISDADLPLDVTDRGIIGLVCRAHRGNVRFNSMGMFSLLTMQEQDTVRKLASLIRIADALDYTRSGSVGAIHCSDTHDEVIINVSATKDISAEMARAREKGDLFTRVFERTLVIR
ncbi:MAG: CHAD domain-containing protein [Methanoregula sp.]|jgi:CHAD domain-containing protein